MAKRKVFGRRKVIVNLGNNTFGRFTFEMHDDGVYMRRLYGRELVTVPFDHLVKLFARQLMLNYDTPLDTSDKNEPMCGVREGGLVPAEPRREGMSLHESPEPETESVPGWQYGMAPLLGPPYPTPEQWAQLNAASSTDNQLPPTD